MSTSVFQSSSKPELFVRETEFFGFTPISFVDDVINSVNEYLYQAMDQLQVFFVEQGKDHSKEEIQKVERVRLFFLLFLNSNGCYFFSSSSFPFQGLDKVVTLLESSIDSNFDKFELYVLKNIFKIPEHVHLPHQLVNTHPSPQRHCPFSDLALPLTHMRTRASRTWISVTLLRKKLLLIESSTSSKSESPRSVTPPSFCACLFADFM